jgi:hypothetical protein
MYLFFTMYLRQFNFYSACKLCCIYLIVKLCYFCLLVKLCKMCVYLLKTAASRPRGQIWIGALGTLPTQIINRTDAAADPNGQKTNKITFRLGRCLEVPLTACTMHSPGVMPYDRMSGKIGLNEAAESSAGAG